MNSLKWHKEVLGWLAKWNDSAAPLAKGNDLAGMETTPGDIEELVKGINSELTRPRLELQE